MNIEFVGFLLLAAALLPAVSSCGEEVRSYGSATGINGVAKFDAALERMRIAWTTNYIEACEGTTNINAIVRAAANPEERGKYALRYAEFVVSLDGKYGKVCDSSLVFCRREMLICAFDMMGNSAQMSEKKKGILTRFREVLESERKWYVAAAGTNQTDFTSHTDVASLKIIPPPPEDENGFREWEAKRQREFQELRRKKRLLRHAEFLKSEIEEIDRLYNALNNRLRNAPAPGEAAKGGMTP